MKHAVLLLGAVELYLTISREGAGISHAAHLFGALAALVYLKGASWCGALATRTRAFAKRRLVAKRANRKRDTDIPREL